MNNSKLFPKKWILIRGLTRSYFHWHDFTELFKNSLQLESVQCPELPGNGYLSTADTPDDPLACVNELKKQIETITEPVGLLGISLGGLIATQWALAFPNEISHLVIINSSFANSPIYHRIKPFNYLSLLKNIFFHKPEDIEKFILETTCNSDNWKSVLPKYVAFQNEHPVRFKNIIRQLQLAQKGRFNQKPDCQILILTSANDRLVNTKCSLLIAKNWGLDSETHPTAGHDLPMDDSSWIISMIQNKFKY